MDQDTVGERQDKSFELLKRMLRSAVVARRAQRELDGRLPPNIGVKLTNRCNLRCEHCYQWNEDGYHHQLDLKAQRADLPLPVLEKILRESRPAKSRVYFWGGEPFVHRQINKILDMLVEEDREIIFCTNGHFIARHLDQLRRISHNLELLIALEGFEAEHDAVRGAGSFRTVTGHINTLQALRASGTFKGKISVHTVIHDQTIGRLEELLAFLEASGVDLVLLCFPWYISEQTSAAMDDYVADRFSWLIDARKSQHSWDAFKYRVSQEQLPALIQDLRAITARKWSNTVRFQPDLTFEEVEPFVLGQQMITRCAPHCTVLETRIDIGPDGKATACKFFSEFNVGDVGEQPLSAVWRSPAYERIRGILGSELSPACSKCNVLYLQNHTTPIHI